MIIFYSQLILILSSLFVFASSMWIGDCDKFIRNRLVFSSFFSCFYSFSISNNWINTTYWQIIIKNCFQYNASPWKSYCHIQIDAKIDFCMHIHPLSFSFFHTNPFKSICEWSKNNIKYNKVHFSIKCFWKVKS